MLRLQYLDDLTRPVYALLCLWLPPRGWLLNKDNKTIDPMQLHCLLIILI